MPVTAKLSRKFYETFGDEIANELVEWFNQVDATYRADLRELNELNFQRVKKTLHRSIVITVGSASHAAVQAIGLDQSLIPL